MKFNTNIPAKLKPFYVAELQKSKVAFSNDNLQLSWKHLETAHIMAQPYPIEHTIVHMKML